MQTTPETIKPKSLATIYEHNSWQSFKSLFIKFGMRLLRIKSGRDWGETLEGNRKPNRLTAPAPLPHLHKEFTITSSEINGSNVYRLQPKENKTSQVILYLHGGAYVGNSTTLHWDFIQKLIKDNNCTVIYPDYPLAPEASYIECFQLLDALYKQILSEHKPEDLIFMGDSAGAGLALAFAQKIKKEKGQLPSQLILLSPWFDVTCTNPEMHEVDQYDPLLNVEGLRKCGVAWAKGGDTKNYLVSPIYGEVEGLPKMSVFISTHDILEPDSRRFRDICDEKGVAINYYNYPKMVHDWLIFGMSESYKALEQIKELLSIKNI